MGCVSVSVSFVVSCFGDDGLAELLVVFFVAVCFCCLLLFDAICAFCAVMWRLVVLVVVMLATVDD